MEKEEIEKLTELQAQMENLVQTQTKLVEKLDKFDEEYGEDKVNAALFKEQYERDKKDVLKEKERFIKDIKEMKERISALEFKSTEKQAHIVASVKDKVFPMIINIIVFLVGLGLVDWLTSLIGG